MPGNWLWLHLKKKLFQYKQGKQIIMTLREFDLAQILQSLELNLDKIHTTTLLTQNCTY